MISVIATSGRLPSQVAGSVDVAECVLGDGHLDTPQPVEYTMYGPLAGLAAATIRRVGDGRIVMLGTLPRAAELQTLLIELGAECDVHPVSDASGNLLVVPRSGPAGEGVMLVELENRPATIELERPATDILTGETLHGRVDIPSYGVAVLRY